MKYLIDQHEKTIKMSNIINTYINAHLQWISKLTAAIYGGQIPDRDVASVDNVCALGKWIHGEGNQLYGNAKEFAELREKHRRFHLAVGQVIDLVNANKMDEAKAEIASGEFRQISGEVINLLSRLRNSIKGADTARSPIATKVAGHGLNP
ncbi:MAG: CZB domain-containing protein [Candidatus Contendobacter sp.]|nr:CZB domain-containing protein [Candidatus Contendobacter sp.]MDS4057913.1 CZB domain-containing protein [Candidatus Contendobacter sp.]